MYRNPPINPFSYSLSRGDFVLIGREELLGEIGRVITQTPPDDRDLHGLPQMGKTTLLRYIAGPQFIERYRDTFIKPFNEHPERLFFVFVSGWNAGTHPFLVLHHDYYRQYRAWQAQHPELAELSPGEPVARDAAHALEMLESHLWALYQRGYRPVILFDDFAGEAAFGALDLDETTRLGLWKDYCSLIFATERLLEEVNPRAKGSPLFKRLTPAEVRPMLPAEAEEFLRVVVDGHNSTLPAAERIALPDAEIAEVVALAGGFPYLLMLGGREVWELRRELGLPAQPDVLLPDGARLDLMNRLAEVFARTFDLYYRNLSEERREVLLDLARRDVVSGQTMREIGRRTQHLGWLTKYGLVTMRPNGDRVLFSPLFRDFLLSLDAQTSAEETGQTPALPRQQADLYATFRGRPNEPLSYVELGQTVWGWPAGRRDEEIDEDEKRKIHLAIHKLRAELDRTGRGERIINVRKRGYRYEPGL